MHFMAIVIVPYLNLKEIVLPKRENGMKVLMRVSLAALAFNLFFLNVLNANEIKKEKRAISDFTKIVISGTGHLLIKQGEKTDLAIETSAEFLPEVRTEVMDNTLYLGPKTSLLSANHPVKYYLTLKNIKDIHTEGSIQVSNKSSISAKELDIFAEGASKIELKLKTDTLKIRVAGDSHAVLSGNTITQVIKIEGFGKIEGKKLLAKHTQVDIKGAGSAIVNAAEKLDVTIEGAGTVEYNGRPKITQEISGAGEIIPLE